MQRIPTIPTLIDCIEKIIPEAKESGSGGNATVFRVEGNYAIKVEPVSYTHLTLPTKA